MVAHKLDYLYTMLITFHWLQQFPTVLRLRILIYTVKLEL